MVRVMSALIIVFLMNSLSFSIVYAEGELLQSSAEATGGLSPAQQQQAFQNQSNLIRSKNDRMALAHDLEAALQPDGNPRRMNLIYGTSFTDKGATGGYDYQILSIVTQQPGYTLDGFVASMRDAYDLYDALQSDEAAMR